MGGEWRVKTLDQLGRIVTGKTPPSSGQRYFDGDIPFVTPTDLDGRRIIDSTGRSLTREGARAVGNSRLPRGSVMVSCIGSDMGKAAIAGHECVTNQQINSVVVESGDDPLFVYYNLSFRRAEIRAAAGGSAQPILNKSDFGRLLINLPQLAEQRAIAHILGTLDNKIELNRKMSETLEAMARALFKSWFVDFDPVRAKAEGRDPGLPKHLAALFPDSFEDSQLGEVPKGWDLGPLGRFFEVGLGGAWGEDEGSDRATVSVRCLRGIDCHELAEGRLPDIPVRWVSPKQAQDRQLSDGTVLIEGSGSFCGRSLIWKRAYGPLLGEPIGYSNFCKRLDPTCSADQAVVCWMQMRQAYRNGVLQSFRTGTAFPNFDVHGTLANLIVVVPPVPVAAEYARVFELSQRLDLMGQSCTLAALRDTLLPKLISGELRVEDPARFLRSGD